MVLVSVAHDHESPDVVVAHEQPPTGDEFRSYELIAYAAVQRVANRERLLVRHRWLYIGLSAVALLGTILALVTVFVSDIPQPVAALGGLAGGFAGAAVGALIGSRLERRRRADRATMLRWLSEQQAFLDDRPPRS